MSMCNKIRIKFLVLCGISLLLSTNPLAAVQDSQSQENNLQTVLQLFQSTAEKNNHNSLPKILTESCIVHIFQEDCDFEFAKEFDNGIARAFNIHKTIIHDSFVKDDRVFIQWTYHMKHVGEYEGRPASQNVVHVSGFSIYRFADGKIEEIWQYWDRLSFYQQLEKQ